MRGFFSFPLKYRYTTSIHNSNPFYTLIHCSDKRRRKLQLY